MSKRHGLETKLKRSQKTRSLKKESYMENNPTSHSILSLNKPWENNNNSIWLASSVSLQRNIEKFNFPNKLDIKRKKQIINLAGKDHLALPQLSNPKLFKAEELSFFDKEFLSEHFLTTANFYQSGAGEGFIIDDTGESITIFNLSDHLTFY